MNELYDVIAIGAGPAGISVAIEGKAAGMNVLLLEKSDAHNASIRKFYKEGKRVDRDYKGQVVELVGQIRFKDCNREESLSFFDELLSKHNIPIKYKSDVESITQTDKGVKVVTTDNQVYEAKFAVVCIGKMGQPNKPSYAIPPTIRKVINFNANDAQSSENILVVGGGNSAVEYAYDLAQNAQEGGSVTLNYRRTEFTRINDINASQLSESIQSGKLKTILGIDIVGLEDVEGKVSVSFANSSKQNFDRVIYAIGGATPVDFLKKCGITTDEKGAPTCSNILESNVKNIFIAGDIALKSGGSIAAGTRHGYDIIQEIIKRK